MDAARALPNDRFLPFERDKRALDLALFVPNIAMSIDSLCAGEIVRASPDIRLGMRSTASSFIRLLTSVRLLPVSQNMHRSPFRPGFCHSSLFFLCLRD